MPWVAGLERDKGLLVRGSTAERVAGVLRTALVPTSGRPAAACSSWLVPLGSDWRPRRGEVRRGRSSSAASELGPVVLLW